MSAPYLSTRPDLRMAIVQALRDVFENEWGGVLSIHFNGRIGLTSLDAAEHMAEPLLVQMEHHGLTAAYPASSALSDGPEFGRIFGKVMQQHPKADIRLVNAVLRIVAVELAQDRSPEPER